jgi:hypothetical protein
MRKYILYFIILGVGILVLTSAVSQAETRLRIMTLNAEWLV